MNSPERHGVLLIGCGIMAAVHCAVLSGMKNPKLVAAVDLDVERAKRFKDTYGFERCGTDYRAELEKKDFDIVLVCTHWPTRLQIIRECFAAGKHVLAEKPLSIYPDEVDEIIAMANAMRRKLRVGMMERFRPMFSKIVELIGQGVIGKPLVYSLMHHQAEAPSKLERTWLYHRSLLHGGVTPNVDCGIHKCDLVRWFSGSDAEQVVSRGCKLEPDSPSNNFNHSIFWMKDGSTLTLEDCWSRNTRPLIYMWMLGDKGRMQFEYAGNHDRPMHYSEEDVIHIWHRENPRHETLYTPCSVKAVGPQMESFMREIEEDRDLNWHYDNVRKATEMVMGTVLSEHRNSIVRFPLTKSDIQDIHKLVTR